MHVKQSSLDEICKLDFLSDSETEGDSRVKPGASSIRHNRCNSVTLQSDTFCHFGQICTNVEECNPNESGVDALFLYAANFPAKGQSPMSSGELAVRTLSPHKTKLER